ncbi:hypothetical protein [Oceaniovalibus sp. ACAM 378]|uniref:hypothetical protein n=1 Tax=Oceaniovalibus sp. ACAM 378 TaxID=2599923 RepID=UPI001CA322A1|nr:hypothetical protein [Oceaniovalibus sp. ACAM 378]
MTNNLNAPTYGHVDPAFVALARTWMQNPAHQLVGLLWQAYEAMNRSAPTVDGRDLERSITQLLVPRISDAMTGDEPFYPIHGPFERETMKAQPAQPPEYDIAFVLRADERIMWPIEAKVLETPKAVAAYIKDVRDEFLTCRYAPFSNSGAMIGYLLSGTEDAAFDKIAEKLSCVLEPLVEHPGRPNRRSQHIRAVPTGKSYPVEFGCYHIIFAYRDLKRIPVGMS